MINQGTTGKDDADHFAQIAELAIWPRELGSISDTARLEVPGRDTSVGYARIRYVEAARGELTSRGHSNRKGVCQDFPIMIAGSRPPHSLRLCQRLLYHGDEHRSIIEGETNAWVEALLPGWGGRLDRPTI